MRRLLVKDVELSLLREHGKPKYEKMLELSVLMTLVAVMSLVGNSQMNLLKLSLQERI